MPFPDEAGLAIVGVGNVGEGLKVAGGFCITRPENGAAIRQDPGAGPVGPADPRQSGRARLGFLFGLRPSQGRNGVPEDALRGVVRCGEAAIVVVERDAIRMHFEGRAETRFAFFQESETTPRIGNVRNMTGPDDVAVRAQPREGNGPQPLCFPGVGDDAELEGQGRLTRSRGAQHVVEPGPVIGMDGAPNP